MRENIAERATALFTDRLVLRPGEIGEQRSVVLTLAHGRELLGIFHWQRLEQKRVHKAEDGRIRANPKGKRQHCGYRKTRRLPELAKRKAKILKQDPHVCLQGKVRILEQSTFPANRPQ